MLPQQTGTGPGWAPLTVSTTSPADQGATSTMEKPLPSRSNAKIPENMVPDFPTEKGAKGKKKYSLTPNKGTVCC